MPLDLDSIRPRLPKRELLWFDSTASTMLEAARLAAEGCPSGTAVLAEEQTAGQGRLGRAWYSEKGSGLYVSVVLRVRLASDSLPALTLALGLAAHDAIARATGVTCDLRWPNDLLVEGKKCAGILVQLLEHSVVAGIGINVNQPNFPPGLEQIATSLRIFSGREQSREELLVHLLEAIDSFTTILMEDGKEQILRLYGHASSFVQGRRVAVEQEDSVLQGTTEGLDPSGFLILRKDDGTRKLILAGGVRPVETR